MKRSPLLEKWYRLRKFPHVPEWDNRSTFEAWGMETGYEPDSILRRRDVTLPYGPENCYWEYPEFDFEEFIKRWNKTVNVLRKHFGLPSFKEVTK